MPDSDPKKISYEAPDVDRPASAAPTEAQILNYESPHPHDPYAALRNRNYVLFITGFFISVIGSQMQVVAARYDVFDKTQTASSMAWIGLSLGIPMLLLTLPAGQIADARSRRRIMVITQILAALSAAGLAWLAYYRPNSSAYLYGVYVFLALGSAVATLGRPARAALMPQLVSAEIFPNAVAWNASVFETASVVGPAIGGFILAVNIALAYLIAAICLAICAAMFWALPEQPNGDAKRQGAGLAELAVGIKFVWNSKIMLGAMTLDLFAVLFGGATYLLPIFAAKILHVGANGFGWLNAAPSIGAISMAMFQAHRPPLRRAGRSLLIAVAGFGLAWTVFGLSRNYWLSFAMLILTGALDNISVVVRHSLVQMLTPNSMRGRVSAVNQIFIGSSNELGGTESGLTASWFGTVPSVVIGGIGTLIVVGLSAIAFPQIRKMGSLSELEPQSDRVGIVD